MENKEKQHNANAIDIVLHNTKPGIEVAAALLTPIAKPPGELALYVGSRAIYKRLRK